MPNIQVINPIVHPDWDDLVLRTQGYSFFHSSFWARVLYESYKYQPLYFTSIIGGEISALLPTMKVDSILTGCRGVSLPFTDYCRAIASDKHCLKKITNFVINYGKRAGWKYFELRDDKNFLDETSPSSIYYVHNLDLKRSEKEIFSKFTSNTKRNIKKAIREGVKVVISDSIDSVKFFYRLNCITRKHHGIPPQPCYFFKNLYDHVISQKKGIVIIAYFKDKIIAGNVYLHFGNKAIYKYGASDRSYQNLRPSNLIMWEAIKWYSEKGFSTLCFGKTEPENPGLRRYKIGWGTEEKILKYYKYDIKKSSFVSNNSKNGNWYKKTLSVMPVNFLRIFGSLLYKHVG